MASTYLIGTAADQVPTNADLGGMAFQDPKAVTITGGSVTGTHQYDTNFSEAKPSLVLDFANGKALDPRVYFNRGTNATYYGVYNSPTNSESSNPVNYQWTQVAGGFGTTKGLYYTTGGGNTISFTVASTAPNLTPEPLSDVAAVSHSGARFLQCPHHGA